MKKRGFTLIELLVVISIISLLSSIVLANLSSVRNKGIIAAGQLFESNVNAKIGDELIAEYNFNEGLTSGALVSDSSGNGNNLSLVGATRVAAGPNGDAISINNFSQNAEGFLNNFNPDEGSISFWVKPSEYTNGVQFPIFSAGPRAGDNAYHAYISFNMQGTTQFPGIWTCGGIQWGYYNSLTTNVQPSELIGRWNHVLVTWTVSDGTKESVYLNGKLIGENRASAPRVFFFEHNCGTPTVTIPGNPVYIYLGTGNQPRYATYQMDRVRIYNKSFQLSN